MQSQDVKVYGADWCHDTRSTRMHLDDLGVPYTYTDVEEDETARAWVLEQNDGKQKLPTVAVGGFVMSIPSNAELDTALRAKKLLDS